MGTGRGLISHCLRGCWFLSATSAGGQGCLVNPTSILSSVARRGGPGSAPSASNMVAPKFTSSSAHQHSPSLSSGRPCSDLQVLGRKRPMPRGQQGRQGGRQVPALQPQRLVPLGQVDPQQRPTSSRKQGPSVARRGRAGGGPDRFMVSESLESEKCGLLRQPGRGLPPAPHPTGLAGVILSILNSIFRVSDSPLSWSVLAHCPLGLAGDCLKAHEGLARGRVPG